MHKIVLKPHDKSKIYWILYLVSLFSMVFKLNIATVLLFVITTIILSIKKPVFAMSSIQCALIANTFLEKYYFLNAILCLCIIAICFLKIKRFRYVKKEEFPVFAVMLYSIIISYLNGYGSILILGMILTMIILCRVLILNDCISMKEVVFSLATVSIFSGVVGLMNESYGLSYGAGSVSRFLSSYGDPNFFCMFSVATIVGLMYLAKNNKYVYVLILIISIFCTLTFSKSLLLLVGLNILVFLWKSSIEVSKKIKLCFIIFIGLVLLNWVLTNLYDQNIILNYIYRFTKEASGRNVIDSLTTGRNNIQMNFLQYFFNKQPIMKMLFGNGYIGTSSIAPMIGLSVETTHMVYLQILMDFGIVGTMLYAYIFIKGFLCAGMVQRQMLLTFFVAMFFLSWQFSVPYFSFYLLLYNDKSIDDGNER